MKEKIEKLKTEFQKLLEKTESLQDLESLKNQFLAKKGVFLYQELISIADNASLLVRLELRGFRKISFSKTTTTKL